MNGRTVLGAAVIILVASLFIGCLGDDPNDEGGSGTGQFNEAGITVNSAEDPWVPDNEFIEPAEGMKFVRYNVTVTNQAEEAMELSAFGFELTTDRNNTYSTSLWSDYSTPDRLAAGADYTMSLVFEIEQDDTGARIAYDWSTFEGSVDL